LNLPGVALKHVPVSPVFHGTSANRSARRRILILAQEGRKNGAVICPGRYLFFP
jgi:hypothetical protein